MTGTIGRWKVSAAAAASPDMSAKGFAALKADIEERGQIVPAVVSGDEIVDGRKRIRACVELGIEPKVIDTATTDPESLAAALNELRTHYTKGQLAMAGERRANLKPGQRADQLRRSQQHAVSQSGAASALGLDRTDISTARGIRRDGHPSVVKAVEGGSLSLAAAREIVKAVSKNEQPQAVKDHIAKKRAPRKKKVAKDNGLAKGYKRSPTVAASTRVETTLDGIESLLDVLDHIQGELTNHGDAPVWVQRLRGMRTRITHHIKVLEVCNG